MIQSAVAGPRVVPLNCRACRAPLPAASNDLAFQNKWIDHGSDIVFDRVTEDVDNARVGVYFDFADMTSIRKCSTVW